MNFLWPWALGIAALVAVPLLAHALLRGPRRPVAFPAAHLVPRAQAAAERPSRLEDRGLLGLRILLLLALALLGASPLLRCERLSLARPDGGSLAVALVLDDSGSMNVVQDGRSRLERARRAAEELLDDARPGDAFSLVLAGSPARLVLAATTDLQAVRSSLARITPSDRATELRGALRLAQSSLEESPHPARRVVVLSDFAGPHELSPSELTDVVAPVPSLHAPFENCALTAGELRGADASVELGCTSGSSLEGREVTVHALTSGDAPQRELGPPLARSPAVEGVVRFSLPRLSADAALVARLSRGESADALPRDDETELLPEREGDRVGVRADPETAGTQTGSVTVIELALNALEKGLRLEPLTVLPDEVASLRRFTALVIDDPPGFTPETQEALHDWLEEGGVALLLLGPSSGEAPLGAAFWPFTRGSPRFAKNPSPGAAPGSAAALGPAWDTWNDLNAPSRSDFDPLPESRTLLGWSDGAPLLVETPVGRGLALVITLPASVDRSDLALRPAFLAALSHALEQARSRRGLGSSEVGSTWVLAPEASIQGPLGPVNPERREDGSWVFSPSVAGRYRLVSPRGTELRYAARPLEESLEQPAPPAALGAPGQQVKTTSSRPISREMALVVLVLGALELAVRALGRGRRPLGEAAGEGGPPSGSPAGGSSSISPA